MANSAARRVHLALSAGALLATALSVARLSPGLPYGSFGPWAFGVLVLGSLALVACLVRDLRSAWSLERGEILRMTCRELPRP